MPIRTEYSDHNGRVTSKPFGYSGTDCLKATQPYDAARNGATKLVMGEAPELQGTIVVPQVQQQQAGL